MAAVSAISIRLPIDGDGGVESWHGGFFTQVKHCCGFTACGSTARKIAANDVGPVVGGVEQLCGITRVGIIVVLGMDEEKNVEACRGCRTRSVGNEARTKRRLSGLTRGRNTPLGKRVGETGSLEDCSEGACSCKGKA